MMFWISSGSVVMSPFSCLILLIRILSLWSLVDLAKGLSILLNFSKNQFLVLLILHIDFFVSTWLISAWSLIIYCCLLLLDEFVSFCSRAFRYAVKVQSMVCSAFFWRLSELWVFLLGLLSLCPISLGMLWLHFH